MIESNPIISALGLTLLHYLWQGLLIGLIYGLFRYLLAGATSQARYALALGALLALTATPIASFFLMIGSAGATAGSGAVSQMTVTAGATGVSQAGTWPGLPMLLPWIVALWAIGVGLMSLRMSLGWWHIHQLRHSADFAIPARYTQALGELAQQLGVRQRVGLATSRQVHGPVLIGMIRPLILMPAALLSGLTPRQLEMVLAHELAHLKRLDHLVNLLQVIVETLLFYHPVVRWVSRDLRVEREIASDELAADLGGDRLAYAETLLALEKARGDRLPLAIGMADRQMLARVRHLLQPAQHQSGTIGAGMAALVLVLATAAISLHDKYNGDESATPEPPEVILASGDSDADKAPNEEQPADRDNAETDRQSETESTRPRTQPEPSAITAESASDTQGAAETEDTAESGTSPSVSDRGDVDDGSTAPADDADSRQAESPPGQARPSRESDDTESDDASPAPTDTLGETMAAETELALLDTAALPAPEARSATTAPIEGGELIHQEAPDYPQEARRQGHEGSVDMRFTVDRQGRVRDVEVIQASPAGYGFEREAMRAVREWRFQPFTRNGEAISHEIETGFDFAEPEECSRRTGSRLARC